MTLSVAFERLVSAHLRRVVAGAAVLAGLCGCASQMEIRALATESPERGAYELNGSNLDALRREAQRLCPGGADVLRQASSGQRAEVERGRWTRWLNVAGDFVEPPQQQAQLLVMCQPLANGSMASLPPLPPQQASVPERAEPVAAAPIGPLVPEW